MYHTDLINSGTTILNAAGLSLEFCKEVDVDRVEGLSIPQKIALKLAISKTQGPTIPSVAAHP